MILAYSIRSCHKIVPQPTSKLYLLLFSPVTPVARTVERIGFWRSLLAISLFQISSSAFD